MSYLDHLLERLPNLEKIATSLFDEKSSGGELSREELSGENLLGEKLPASKISIAKEAQALFLLLLARNILPGPLLVGVSTIAEAEELTAELKAWVEGEAGDELGNSIAMLPAWETIPFERVSPTIEVMGKRLSVLYQLQNADSQDIDSQNGLENNNDLDKNNFRERNLQIIVAPVRALLQKTAFQKTAASKSQIQKPTPQKTTPSKPIPPNSFSKNIPKTPPPNSFSKNIEALDLKVGSISSKSTPTDSSGQEFSMQDLLSWLGEKGYRREIQVSARGEMAVRGGIVDVFASAPINDNCDEPLRIEFFGDTIDSMRTFSLVDQLTTGEVKRARLFPAREFIPSEAEKARAKELVETHKPESHKPESRQHFEDLAQGVFFEGMESWMPWLVEGASPITNQLSDSVKVIWLDKNEMRHTAKRQAEQEKDLTDALMETWNMAGTKNQPKLTAEFEDIETAANAEITSLPADSGTFKTQSWGVFGPEVIAQIKQLLADGFFVSIPCFIKESTARMKDALYEEGIQDVSVITAPISRGCIFTELKLAILPEAHITKKQYFRPKETRAQKPSTAKSDWMGQLTPGAFVVHQNHGVGKYVGTETKTISATDGNNVEREYLIIQYKGKDRLYLPADQIGMLSLYSVGETPRLNSLGGSGWKKTRRQAKAEAEEIAKELVELYGERSNIKGYQFAPDSAFNEDLAATFPYLETPDQMEAIKQTAADMEKPAPMDRLIYGDVGFGKTEIAIRAAFKAIAQGKQVAVLVPTTLLARQHFHTFSERYGDFGVRVEMLSRLVPASKAKQTIKDMAMGKVDLVIGTHRLLSADIRFKDLGLLVVDEEQRFGVKQKEKIKSLNKNVDILTLTATPIPRTLEMSLTGIRDYSVIRTSPLERHPILTYVGIYDPLAVKEAIKRELLREGQVFFVHNRIGSLGKIQKELSQLVPEARIAVAHGRMNEVQLEKVVLDFTDKKYDVLLCTTIIEAGIDMPRVNTLVVDRAERLGLGQLHQLRGRVGRAGVQAYAYLFTSEDVELSPEAVERLRTIGEVTALGSGFHLAMRDLEIRGAGNLLGFGQSGHIASVGYDMYCDLVNNAVSELKGQPVQKKKEVIMDLPVEAHLPIDFVEDEALRLDAYRKLFSASDFVEGEIDKDSKSESSENRNGEADDDMNKGTGNVSRLREFTAIDEIGNEWRDRFGPLPAEAEQLLLVAKIRALCRRLDIETLSVDNLPIAKLQSESQRNENLSSNTGTKNTFRIAPVSAKYISKLNKTQLLHNIGTYDSITSELTIELSLSELNSSQLTQLNRIGETDGDGEISTRHSTENITNGFSKNITSQNIASQILYILTEISNVVSQK